MKKIKVALPLYVPTCIPCDRDSSKRTLVKLTKPFHVWINDKEYIIPSGFVFNGNIPIIARALFDPLDFYCLAGYVIHDWLYAGEFVPRKYADEVFYSTLELSGVPKWKRSLMYAAVRIGGGFTYSEHTEQTVMHIRKLSGYNTNTRPLWEEL